MRAEVTRELTQLRAEFGFSDRAMDSIIHFVQRLQTRTALALGVSEEDVADVVGVPMRGVTAKRMRPGLRNNGLRMSWYESHLQVGVA